ncbi:MAG TPA: cupin domain-containing protein [Baekduia sp.]|uniref:cupin domain-containing protein n=1 Tax=Baekduia sp. TaxID=2600305 RepID=UPI002C26A6F3|nr:cupin domain-containing protein [Baekduia sp.]HMJ36346.1 cupin domain-containing protein [Baekduia sp.]
MSPDAPDPPLGPRLRELRRRRGLSIKAAAEQAGVSPSFLSLVERSQSDLAMSRLMRLLTLYGASLIDLVDATDAPTSDVIRGGEEIHVTSHGERIDAYMLVADPDRVLVPMIWVYEPGASMGEAHPQPADHFSYVIEGSVLVELDDERYELTAGDTVYVRAGRRFRVRNTSERVARLLGCGHPVAPRQQKT